LHGTTPGEVFSGVDPVVRGQVKQVIDYRNWVAHGQTLAKPGPTNVVPVKAHQVLTAFLVQTLRYLRDER